MTIAILLTRPASSLNWGSRCYISDGDGAISPTVSPVSTAYPVSLGSIAVRCPGSSTSGAETSPYTTPLRLEAEMANRDIVSPQAITVLLVAKNVEQNNQLLHQAWRAI